MKRVILSFVLIVFSLRIGAEGVTIQEDTKFELQDGTTLELPAGSVLQVDNGATKGEFKALGTVSSYDAVITHSEAGTYSVVIEGTIDCQYFTFEYMDANGIWIKDGATIINFDNGKLTNGASGGTLIQIDERTNGPYYSGGKQFNGIAFVKPGGNTVRYNAKTNFDPGADDYYYFEGRPAEDNYGGDQRDRDPRDSDYATCNPDPPALECDATSQGAIIWETGTGVELPDTAYTPGKIVPSLWIPNPFPEKTIIHYSVPENAGNLRVIVYDKSGRLVRTLINEKKKAGHYTITWDGKDNNSKRVGSGIYFVKFELELANKKKFETIRKATLMR